MYRIYYFGFNNYSGTRIITLAPLGKIWKLAAFATTTTTTTTNNHNNTGGNHTYM
jgi:hypothetical protein